MVASFGLSFALRYPVFSSTCGSRFVFLYNTNRASEVPEKRGTERSRQSWLRTLICKRCLHNNEALSGPEGNLRDIILCFHSAKASIQGQARKTYTATGSIWARGVESWKNRLRIAAEKTGYRRANDGLQASRGSL